MKRCPMMKKTCLPDQCMFGVRGKSDEIICRIVVAMHNLMVVASRLDKIADKLLGEEEKEID